MLTKTLGWAIVSLCAVCLVWWLLDPIGFASNPVFRYLNLRSSGNFHKDFPMPELELYPLPKAA
jgi:hypothetical protein